MITDLLKKIIAFFLDITETIVIALSIFVVIYLLLVQPHQVKGSSMMPNYQDGEFILTNKLTYRLHSPKRGDVIIFEAPKNNNYDYIKRIIGLPMETVMLKNGMVFINGHLLKEPYLNHISTDPGSFLKENKEFTVPPDEYIVFGDNREHSSDSRDWGTVPRKNIIGKAWLRYWPIPEIGLLPSVSYEGNFTNSTLRP